MYQLPWDVPDVRRVIEAFDCIVMEIETVPEDEVKEVVSN